MNHNNPLLVESDVLYGAVPFDKIKISDYEEAIEEGIRRHQLEIDAIAENPEVPDFENTVAALDRSGNELTRVMLTLGNLEAALGDERLMKIMADVTPRYSEHCTAILLNVKLWERIKAVYDSKATRADLSPEALRLIDET